MNLRILGDAIYASESGMARVKRYSLDGKYLDLTGYVGLQRINQAGGLAASCSNVAIAVTPNGGKVYIQDVKKNLIRVLEAKAGKVASSQPASAATSKPAR
jgi:hypothetical protein